MFVCNLVSVLQLPSDFCFWILTPTLLSQSVVPSVVFTVPLTLMCPQSVSDTVRSCSAPVAVTVKFVELVAMPLGVVTEIGPVVAPEGTVALMRVAFCTLKVFAETPLKRTAVAPVKFVPLIRTEVPTGPLVGLNDVIVGAPVAVTVKFVELVAVPLGVVTEIGPVVAPEGTVALTRVAFCTLKVFAETPLKRTAVAPVKFVPLIWTEVPTGPLAGLNDVIVGAPVVVTVKFVEVVAVPSGLVTTIGPVLDPDGTVAVIFCALSIVNVADVPLKVTLVTLGPLKLWPWIVTEVPTGPLAGENEVIVGAAARAASAPGRTTKITVSNTVAVTWAARMRIAIILRSPNGG
jgi:hypothetical protein